MATDEHSTGSIQIEGRETLRRQVVAYGLGVALCLAVIGLGLQQRAGVSVGMAAVSVSGFLMLLSILPVWVAAEHHHHRFGAANVVTLIRAGMTALLFACVGQDASAPLMWAVVIVAALALSLDAVDGFLARRQGTASRFGARFDMEVDAALILVLAVLVWQFDQAGGWVLASGLMRYAFVAAGAAWPWLRAPLPPSRRRQSVCVFQGALLVLALVPVWAEGWSTGLATLGLAVLAASFAADVLWLARRAPSPTWRN